MTGKNQGIIRAAGAMSGTSMDGVDLAVIKTDGVEIAGFGEARFRPYDGQERDILFAAQGCWPKEPGVAAAAALVDRAHLDLAWGIEAEVLGYHGQTLAHAPRGRGTHQAGDGAVLARGLGLPVVWDFRSADVRLGGQGAPMACFYHWALARHIGARAPIAVLNLGGVGNLTWVDPNASAPDVPGALLAFDTGPANAPMDDLMRARGLGNYDKGGILARSGRADTRGVAAFLKDEYFTKTPPKSLDRGAFGSLIKAVAGLDPADAMATLAECVTGAIVRGMAYVPQPPAEVLVAGGGRRNAALMEGLRRDLAVPVRPVEALGLDGDSLEAQAFAYLAVRAMRGMTISAPGTTGVPAPAGGGRISQPGQGS
ncbi:MAG: anhydro-N-acetylmuramic acid kinase [Rhodobacteraceae bacterium]|nr:anhydro-N-acetylmuramic acid kinase [Paracoccaceae bacterium]